MGEVRMKAKYAKYIFVCPGTELKRKTNKKKFHDTELLKCYETTALSKRTLHDITQSWTRGFDILT
ncbi:hypothetical protein SK128_018700, partial [Halocaridina rubra]